MRVRNRSAPARLRVAAVQMKFAPTVAGNLATRRYALDSLEHPRFLTPHWQKLVRQVRRQAKAEGRFELPGEPVR